MARILFIQRLCYEFPGTEALSASLKNRGHETDLLIDDSPDIRNPIFRNTDIVAFSVMTGSEEWALAVGKRLKAATGALIVFGGPHPTHCPEIVREEGVDAICRGEGDEALVDLADRLDQGLDITTTANFWIKRGNKVIRNDVRSLVADLDALPLPDRELYYRRYPLLARNPHKPFMAGRGCPYSCSFCSNEALRALYRGQGAYVRMRSPENLLAEIRQVRDHHSLTKVFFHDDTFVLNAAWLDRFLEIYRNQIGLPFYCQSRADTLTDELAGKLKQAGCRCVFFAVESGIESLRRGVLRKELSDEQIIACARLLKKHGIKISTYNLIGIPGETIDDVFATIRLNIAIKADYPRCSFLTPYPGTELGAAAPDSCCVSNISALSQQSDLLWDIPDNRVFRNTHALFQTAVLFPWTFELIKRLVRLPCTPIFRLWWAVIYVAVLIRSEGRGPTAIFPFLLMLVRQRLVKLMR